jgi:DNA-binding beta-propeller fold protein YncE
MTQGGSTRTASSSAASATALSLAAGFARGAIEKRIPCPKCNAPIIEGARKCKACKAWLDGRDAPAPVPRAALIVTTAVATVMAVIVSSRESPVGEAPPLTRLGGESASASAAAGQQPSPAAFGPEIEPEPEAPPPDPNRPWRAREIRIGEVHPLDIAWNPRGQSIYVTADDATLREYRIKGGDLIHQASMPAQGDQIRVLFGRWVAVLRHQDAARIPVMDTTTWDRDPILLDVGQSPGDIIEMPDGRTVVAASTEGKRVSRFDLVTGTRLADITLPHATGELFLVRAEKRPYIGAMGALKHGGQPAGAWLDLFDPAEAPFGATRRSIAVGREPRSGAVSADGGSLFFPDRVSNTAVLLRVAGITEEMVVPVDSSPEAGFLMDDDRYGVTINSGGRTATVIGLPTHGKAKMDLKSTLMLSGVPCAGDTSPDHRTLFVSLGGTEKPPKGSGVDIIAGDPPKVVGSLPTAKGGCAVAVARDGARAAVASYYGKSITILEQ